MASRHHSSRIRRQHGRQQAENVWSGRRLRVRAANLSLLYTNARFDYLDTSRLTLQNFEVSLTDYVTPQLVLGAAYIFTTGQYHPQDNSPKWHQVNTGVDYLLSKRTDLFLVAFIRKRRVTRSMRRSIRFPRPPPSRRFRR